MSVSAFGHKKTAFLSSHKGISKRRLCAYSIFSAFPVYPLSVKTLILWGFLRYRYHTPLFNRPGFQRMLADIKEGKIKRVIVKDMSRFGRDYLQVGMYTDVLFPDFGVHFIAVNDGVDSTRGESASLKPALRSPPSSRGILGYAPQYYRNA